MTHKNKPIPWREVKPHLQKEKPEKLLGLIGELYDFSQDNRTFVVARYSLGDDPLAPYKEIIHKSLYPDSTSPIRLSAARKAITDYRKAVSDKIGLLELMVYYVECGTQLVLDFACGDERFYDSLESMFSKVVRQLRGTDQQILDIYLPRLRKIVDQTVNVGWGYHHFLGDCLYEAFPDA